MSRRNLDRAASRKLISLMRLCARVRIALSTPAVVAMVAAESAVTRVGTSTGSGSGIGPGPGPGAVADAGAMDAVLVRAMAAAGVAS